MHALTYNVAEWNGHSVALQTPLGATASGCMSNAQICPTTESYTHPRKHINQQTQKVVHSPHKPSGSSSAALLPLLLNLQN